MKVHLRNQRNQELQFAVAYFVPGGESPIARAEGSLTPGESLSVDMDSSCLFKVCVPGSDDEPFQVQAVVSVLFEKPVTTVKNPAAFDDPLVGFEVFDTATGRTEIWGDSEGVQIGLLPVQRQK